MEGPTGQCPRKTSAADAKAGFRAKEQERTDQPAREGAHLPSPPWEEVRALPRHPPLHPEDRWAMQEDRWAMPGADPVQSGNREARQGEAQRVKQSAPRADRKEGAAGHRWAAVRLHPPARLAGGQQEAIRHHPAATAKDRPPLRQSESLPVQEVQAQERAREGCLLPAWVRSMLNRKPGCGIRFRKRSHTA